MPGFRSPRKKALPLADGMATVAVWTRSHRRPDVPDSRPPYRWPDPDRDHANGDFIPGADVVELLEHGLRLDSDDPVDAQSPQADPGAAGPSDRDDEPAPLVAIDLGDTPVIDLDAGDD